MKQLVDPQSPKDTPFRTFHNDLALLSKGRVVYSSSKTRKPYVKPKVDEVKGKWQRKAAKRARHGK